MTATAYFLLIVFAASVAALEGVKYQMNGDKMRRSYVDGTHIPSNDSPHQLGPRDLKCLIVAPVILVLDILQGPGSTFCSSLLHLSTSTKVTTKTPPPSFVTHTQTQTTSIFTTINTYVPELKRRQFGEANARKAIVTPARLNTYPDLILSEACSCRNLPTKFTTITTTAPTPVSQRLISA
jgi:hypothetical protein